MSSELTERKKVRARGGERAPGCKGDVVSPGDLWADLGRRTSCPHGHREIFRAHFEVEVVPLSPFHLLHLGPQDAAPKQASLGAGQQGRKAARM